MLKKKVLILCLIINTQQSFSFIDSSLDIDMKIWEFTRELTQLSEQSKELQMYSSTQLENLKNLTDKSPNEIMIMEGLEALHDSSKKIDRYFSYIHMKHDSILPRWNDTVVEEVKESPLEIDRLRNLLVPKMSNRSSDPGLLMKIAQLRAASVDDPCDQTQTTQYLLISILNRVLLAELKMFAIISMSTRFHYTKDNIWNLTTKQASKDFYELFPMYLTAGIDAVKLVQQGAVRACDPPNGWILDETYFEMERLEYTSWFISTNLTAGVCYHNRAQNPMDECHGSLGDCKRTSVMLACWAVMNLENNYKRWHWIKTWGNNFGAKSNLCDNAKADFYYSQKEKDPFNCLCRCSSDNETSVSLGLSLSNVTNNKVITGVRFKRENNTLYIQIQEGKLQPNGRIDRNSRIWVPLPTDSPTTYLNHTYKSFILNDLVVPLGYVLVGVQFVNDSKMALRAIGQKFDYANGILLPDTIEISTNQEDEYDQLRFVSVSSVNGENLSHKPDSDKHYVELGQSTWEFDIGQSVLPLFDGVAVVTDPPTPLGGIGLFHKGVEGYAGFLSLRLHSLPYRLYLEKMLRNYKFRRILNECNQPSCSFDDIFDLGEKVHRFMEKTIETEQLSSDQFENMDSIFKNHSVKSELAVDFNHIRQKLDGLNYYMKINDLTALIKNATGSFIPVELENKIEEEFVDHLRWIEIIFIGLIQYSKETSLYYSRFLGASTTYRIFPKKMDQLQELLLSSSNRPESGRGFIDFIAKESAIIAETQCMGSWSIQHVLAQIFRAVIVTEMKAMVTLSLSYRVYVSTFNEDWKSKSSEIRDNFKDRFMRYVKAFAEAMHTAPKYVEACDHKSDAVALGNVVFNRNLTNFPINPGRQPPWKLKTVISLAANRADVHANQVVTGLRFVLQNNTLHLQIKQGKLLPNGWIDAASQSWVPLPKHPIKTIRRMDIHKFFCGNITFPPEYAVVGVRFIMTNDLSITATARKFDFSTGELLPRFSLGKTSMKGNTLHAHLLHVRHPDNNCIKLQDLSKKTKCPIQPRFETLPVEVQPPTPLSGIEFIHKSSKNCSELISLRLLTYRYEEKLRDFIEKINRNETCKCLNMKAMDN